MPKFTQTQEDKAPTAVVSRNKGRDEDLMALDAIVGPKVKEWQEAGKPAPIDLPDGMKEHNPLSPYVSLDVAKDEKAAIKSMARRSAALFKVDTIFYQDTEPTDQGIVTVAFTFKDRPETDAAKAKREKAEKEAAEKAKAEAPPADTPPADTPPATDGEAETEKARGLLRGRR